MLTLISWTILIQKLNQCKEASQRYPWRNLEGYLGEMKREDWFGILVEYGGRRKESVSDLWGVREQQVKKVWLYYLGWLLCLELTRWHCFTALLFLLHRSCLISPSVRRTRSRRSFTSWAGFDSYQLLPVHSKPRCWELRFLAFFVNVLRLRKFASSREWINIVRFRL